MHDRPTADALRPTTLDDIVGQPHLFGKNGSIRRMLERGHIPNMIFFGPPGTGKTTAAGIIAASSGMTLHRLNATTASIADVHEITKSTSSLFGSGGILLYLDEIQYFNKKQQQSLLEYIEDGRITLIASTTENPYIYVYNAIVSRSAVFEFKAVPPEALRPVLLRALDRLNADQAEPTAFTDDALDYIAAAAAGDVRRSINLLESAYFCAADATVTLEIAKNAFPSPHGHYDRDGSVHFDMLSALQKSIRGSDPDAAVFYLARILEGGDLIGACRRLQVIASEDIGLAYPMAAAVVRACVESAKELGMPEARIPLAHAALLLATAPKSNSAEAAYDAAKAAVESGAGRTVPPYMSPTHQYQNYKYPHAFPNHWVDQQYLPDELKNARFYEYGENKTEQAAKAYWDKIKGKT
ncbi:MAG: replication-associated recombination protein A [Clostridia bacterium]|nr:replication-associated recombination protein A [Clostridia bacterium]